MQNSSPGFLLERVPQHALSTENCPKTKRLNKKIISMPGEGTNFIPSAPYYSK